MIRIDFMPVDTRPDETIELEFDEPFVHTDPFQGIYIYGGFNEKRQLLKDYTDDLGYRRVRFKNLSTDKIVEVKLTKRRLVNGTKCWVFK